MNQKDELKIIALQSWECFETYKLELRVGLEVLNDTMNVVKHLYVIGKLMRVVVNIALKIC